MRRRSTIRWRLTVFYGVVFLACGAFLLFVAYVQVRSSLITEQQDSVQTVIEEYGYTAEGVAFVRNIPVPPPAVSGARAETVGDVIDGVQVDQREETLSALLVGSTVALAAAGAIAIGVGWLAAGRALRPVGELTARARALSEDNLDARVGFEGPDDELKRLADTLDGMLGRLEGAFVAQRGFAASVSHELRTPLAIMRAEVDLALSDADVTPRERHLAEAVRASVDRTEALLDSLLTLARSESTIRERSVVDLAELAGDVVSERIAAADAAGVRLDLELGTATVAGDRWLLERLVANLVDNGITHNQPGGWLTVSVETRAGRAVVRTTNPGDPLTPEQVSQILEPFRRVAADRRPGYGLGMTIVQSVAKAHGGTVDVWARDGGGLEVEVSLPEARSRRAAEAPHPLPAPA